LCEAVDRYAQAMAYDDDAYGCCLDGVFAAWREEFRQHGEAVNFSAALDRVVQGGNIAISRGEGDGDDSGR